VSKFRLEDRLLALKTYVPGYDPDGTIHVSGEAFQAIQETAAEALELIGKMGAVCCRFCGVCQYGMGDPSNCEIIGTEEKDHD